MRINGELMVADSGGRGTGLRARLQGLNPYEKFEYIVCVVISIVITVVVCIALLDLVRNVFQLLLLNIAQPVEHKTFQLIFGMILTLFIAMEFRHSIHNVLDRRGHIVQVRSVILIALLAVARKFIVIDTVSMDAVTLIALGFITLALGGVYWLLKYFDARA